MIEQKGLDKAGAYITLPVTMKDTNYFLTAMNNDYNSGSNSCTTWAYLKTVTDFYVRTRIWHETSTQNNTGIVTWVVTGY